MEKMTACVYPKHRATIRHITDGKNLKERCIIRCSNVHQETYLSVTRTFLFGRTRNVLPSAIAPMGSRQFYHSFHIHPIFSFPTLGDANGHTTVEELHNFAAGPVMDALQDLFRPN